MNQYKKYIPIIAVILVALGFNFDKFGIDLEALSRGESITQSGTQTGQNSQSTGSNSSASSTSGSKQGAAHPSYKQWSDTSPEINLWHVFEGEINRKGKPVGFHSRPNGQNPGNAKVVSIRDKPNKAGVYTANIAIRDGSQWKEKFSSFFPDSMSQSEVVDAILAAYKNSRNQKQQPWQGPSGLGFNIQGYTTSRGGINTAFPVYVRSQ